MYLTGVVNMASPWEWGDNRAIPPPPSWASTALLAVKKDGLQNVGGWTYGESWLTFSPEPDL